jgi:hypothetical protein
MTIPLREDLEAGIDVFDSMNFIECRRIFSNARSTLPQIREAASSSLERLSLVGVTGCKRKGRVADVRRRAVQLLVDDAKSSTERDEIILRDFMEANVPFSGFPVSSRRTVI